jgi:hypothetical protein
VPGGAEAFLARLDLPAPAHDAAELEAMLEARHGEAGRDRLQAILSAGTGERAQRRRYELIYARPSFALDFTFGYAGDVTRKILDAVDELAPRDGPALDLGSGDGLLAAFLAARDPDRPVTAVDLRPQAVACAEHLARTLGLPNLRGRRATIRRLPRTLLEPPPALVCAIRVAEDVALPALASGTLIRVDRPGGEDAAPGHRLVSERELEARELDAWGTFRLRTFEGL